MSTERPNTTDDEGVKDGIHYGVDEDGNEFFTAAGSESHRAAKRKKEATDAGGTETVSEENKATDTAAKPERKKRIANQIANEARANAPVLTRAYRDGIGVAVEGMTVKVIDSDDDAIHKEYGT